MDDNKKIAVNTNYIYWAMMKMAQKKKRQNVLELKKQIKERRIESCVFQCIK